MFVLEVLALLTMEVPFEMFDRLDIAVTVDVALDHVTRDEDEQGLIIVVTPAPH